MSSLQSQQQQPLRGGGGGSGGITPPNRYGPTASPFTRPSMENEPLDPKRRERAAVGAGIGAGTGGGMSGWDDDDMDDHLHTFTEKDRKDLKSSVDLASMRGWANAGMLLVLLGALVGIFAVYPAVSFYTKNRNSDGVNTAGYNLGGVNASGQFPEIPGLPRLIDPDTPESAMRKTGYDGNEWVLVFSDEFNVEGRTFYEGDDPFWTAMDLNYWPTV